jgi:cellobiose-specific phosphotransferase system component IIA
MQYMMVPTSHKSILQQFLAGNNVEKSLLIIHPTMHIHNGFAPSQQAKEKIPITA